MKGVLGAFLVFFALTAISKDVPFLYLLMAAVGADLAISSMIDSRLEKFREGRD